MSDNYAELRQRIPKKQPDYKFRTVWCGTPKCGVMYNVQTNYKSGAFISASTYVRGGDKSQTIVPRCIKCDVPLGEDWLAECLAAKPEPYVHGRDERDDVNGPIL